MASLDIKDAYYAIPVAEEYQKYLTLNRPGGGGGAESAHRLVLASAVLKR